MNTTIKKMVFFPIFLLCILYGKAQVTIGMDEAPAVGTLLDLKDEAETSGEKNATKGVKFPRVELSALNTLEPLLSAQQAADAAQKQIHKGTVVYNVNDTSPLQEGLYYWDGNEWNFARSMETADDPNAWKMAGNAGTNAANNFIGTTDAVDFSVRTNNENRVRVTSDGNVGIGTITPGAFRLNVEGNTQLNGTASITGNTTIGGTATIAGATTINNAVTVTGTTTLNGGLNGGVTISGLTDIANGNILVADENGKVATIATAPVSMCFVQSKAEQILTTQERNDFNTGTSIVVEWDSNEIQYNNLMSYENNVFTFEKPCKAEVSGFVFYMPNCSTYTTTPTFATHVALINLLVQRRSPGGDWHEFAGGRAMYVTPGSGSIVTPVIIPPTVGDFIAGDQLRVILQRPPLGSNSFLGLPHGMSGSTNRIDSANGMEITKNLKIQAL